MFLFINIKRNIYIGVSNIRATVSLYRNYNASNVTEDMQSTRQFRRDSNALHAVEIDREKNRTQTHIKGV